MATVTIPWLTGGGNITVTYTGVGNDSPSVSSSVNEGIDREQNITYETEDKSLSVAQRVLQTGKREVYNTLGGDAYFLSEGQTYNVIK
jgi:hypothetical protein